MIALNLIFCLEKLFEYRWKDTLEEKATKDMGEKKNESLSLPRERN